MIHGISVSFTPIGPWFVIVGGTLTVTVLTLWAYSRRLKGSGGRLALFCPDFTLIGLVALSLGGAAAVGGIQREKETSRVRGRPG